MSTCTAQKVQVIKLNDEKYAWRNIGAGCIDTTCIVVTNQPEAFALDLGDDQSRYLFMYLCGHYKIWRQILWKFTVSIHKSRPMLWGSYNLIQLITRRFLVAIERGLLFSPIFGESISVPLCLTTMYCAPRSTNLVSKRMTSVSSQLQHFLDTKYNKCNVMLHRLLWKISFSCCLINKITFERVHLYAVWYGCLDWLVSSLLLWKISFSCCLIY